jgi:hypothetical protein
MYRKSEQSSITPEKFELSPQARLSPDNRWVIMANLIPWEEFEEAYLKTAIRANCLQEHRQPNNRDV